MVAMPMQPPPKNPLETKAILNYIYVNEINSLKLNKINEGGFSTIYLSEMQFSYVYSSESHNPLHPDEVNQPRVKRFLHKYVVIKK